VKRSDTVYTLAASLALIMLSPAWSSEPAPENVRLAIPASGSFGLLVTDRSLALAESPDRKECPHGFNAPDRAQALAQFPTPEAKAAQEKRYGYGYSNRGANGENVFYNPLSTTDPLPFYLSESDWAPGFNLDDKDGPQNYTNHEGVRGVDNQMNRIFGCISTARTGGFMWQFGNMGVRQYAQNRLMWEISGVTDPMNDPDVTVRSYRGMDPINFSSDDKPVPWATERIDYERGRRYMSETKGHIVNGVLITDPVDMWITWRSIPGAIAEFKLRGARLHVQLNATGGQGYLGGYADIDTFMYGLLARNASGAVGSNQYSPPSVYRALHTLADGYPDASGHNTAISIQFSQQFVAVYVRHNPADERPQNVASNDRTPSQVASSAR